MVNQIFGNAERRYAYDLKGSLFLEDKGDTGGWWITVNETEVSLQIGLVSQAQCHQIIDGIFSAYSDEVIRCNYYHVESTSGTQLEKCHAMCDDNCASHKGKKTGIGIGFRRK